MFTIYTHSLRFKLKKFFNYSIKLPILCPLIGIRLIEYCPVKCYDEQKIAGNLHRIFSLLFCQSAILSPKLFSASFKHTHATGSQFWRDKDQSLAYGAGHPHPAQSKSAG